MRYFLILIFVTATFIACGVKDLLVLYDGERRIPTEVAIIQIGNVYLMQVDSLKRKYQAISVNNIEVLPDRHILGLGYSSQKGRSRRIINLEFTAVSGHTYLVKARAGYNHWTPWIIDVAFDSIVAGSKDLNDKEHRGLLNWKNRNF